MSFALPVSQAEPTSGRMLTQPASASTIALDAPRDGDLQAQAEAVLTACPYREVQKINCLLSNGVMFLRGQVSSFYLKQVAQTIMMNIKGVRQVVNAIQVRNTNAVTTNAVTTNAVTTRR